MKRLFSYTFNDILINRIQISVNKYIFVNVFNISYQIDTIHINLKDVDISNLYKLYITIQSSIAIEKIDSTLPVKQINKGRTTRLTITKTACSDIFLPIELIFINKTTRTILINDDLINSHPKVRCILSYFPIGYDLEYDPILHKKDLVHSIVPIKTIEGPLDLFRMHLIQLPIVVKDSRYINISFNIPQLTYNPKFYEYIEQFSNIIQASNDNLCYLQYVIKIIKYFMDNSARIIQDIYTNIVFKSENVMNSTYINSKSLLLVDKHSNSIVVNYEYFINSIKTNPLYQLESLTSYNIYSNDLSLLIIDFKNLYKEIASIITKYNLVTTESAIQSSSCSIYTNNSQSIINKNFELFLKYIVDKDENLYSNFIIEAFKKGDLLIDVFIKTFIYIDCIQPISPIYVSIKAYTRNNNNKALLVVKRDLKTVYVLDKLLEVDYYDLLINTASPMRSIKIINSTGICSIKYIGKANLIKQYNVTVPLAINNTLIVLIYDLSNKLIHKILLFIYSN